MRTYAARLNLAYDPFQPGQDQGEFFASTDRQALLQGLGEFSEVVPNLTVVSGCLGVGKSSLVKQFCANCGDGNQCVRVDASLFMTPANFFDTIKQQLPIAAPDGEAVIASLQDLARDLDLEARALFLVIDDAHEMSSDLLDAVAELLNTEPAGKLRVLMFGEPQLGEILAEALPAEYVAEMAQFDLNGLGFDDTVAYIQDKLLTAGLQSPQPLEQQQLEDVFARSQGIPGTINAIAAEVLDHNPIQVDGPDEATKVVNNSTSYWVFATLLGVALLMVVLFYPQEPDPGQRIELARPGSQTPAPTASQEAPFEPLSGAQAVAGLDNDSTPEVGSPAPVLRSDSGSEVAATANDNPAPSPTRALESASATAAMPASPQVDDAPAPVAQEAPASPSAAVESAPVEPTIAAAPVPAPAAARAQQPEPETTPSFTAHERRLLQFAPNSFTVQIMAARSEQNIQGFIAAAEEIDEPLYFETRFQERPWFVVVVGNYPHRAAASAAISQLPEQLRELSPWIRPLSDIQADIRALTGSQ